MGEAKSYFFCGIGGSGMLPLALIVQGRGARVAGSDRTLDQGRLAAKFEFLKARGIALFGQDGSGLASADQILVTSAAIEETVSDVVKANELGAARMTRPQLLAELFNGAATGIAVGGTSGKSTVTGMIGWILHATGRDPTVMNGAVMKNFVSAELPFASALVGAGDAFVSEVDESDGSIALYRPDIAVLNNVTLDHKSLDELRHLFGDFAAKAQTVVLNLDDDETRLLAATLPRGDLRTYSLKDRTADLLASNIVQEPFSVSFRVNRVRVRLQLPGLHNVQNALAALAVVEAAGVPLADAAEALAGFTGLRRRFEKVGEVNDVTVIDDFAHNPDKIGATLRTLHAFPGRVLLFFQPHGYGPLRTMKDELIGCFAREMGADDVLIMPDPVYFGGTTNREVGTEDITMGVQASGLIAEYHPSRDECAHRLTELARPGDRIVVMGARDDTLSQFAQEILELLDPDRAHPDESTDDMGGRPGPIDARVVDGQLRLIDETHTVTEMEPSIIDAARLTHFATAKRLCTSLAGSNVGEGFNARLECTCELLSRTLSRERCLQLALEVRGLEHMLPTISERLDNVTVADVGAFVGGLSQLVRQFPDYRRFVEEASDLGPASTDARNAASALASRLSTQPDSVVAPDLKQALAGIQANDAQRPDRVTSLALVRSVANVFRALGRFSKDHAKAISREAGGAFDKSVGGLGGRTLAVLVVGPPTVLLLRQLAAAYPGEFGFVEQLLHLARTLLERLGGLA